MAKRYKGNVSYRKLWNLMRERGLRKRNLREDYNMSPTLIKRSTDTANVAVDTIMHLCEILNCQPGDIMEYIKE